MTKKSQSPEKMTEKEYWENYKSYFTDFDSLSKKDLEINLMEKVKEIFRLEKEVSLLHATEKERIRLLNENFNLKKEIGKLFIVKKLMETAEVYSYQDFFKKFSTEEKSE